MIDQNGYIMTASDKMTHTPILSRRKRRGMYPEMESNTNPAKSMSQNDDMLPEYDFTGKSGVRGKYYRDY